MKQAKELLPTLLRLQKELTRLNKDWFRHFQFMWTRYSYAQLRH